MILNHIQVCDYIENKPEPENEDYICPEMFLMEDYEFKPSSDPCQSSNDVFFNEINPFTPITAQPLTFPQTSSDSIATFCPNYEEKAEVIPAEEDEEDKEASLSIEAESQPKDSSYVTPQAKKRREKKQVHVRKGKFTEAEDKLLKDLVTKHGRDWTLISRLMSDKGRKKVKERYDNFLSKKLNRRKFTAEEDKKIAVLIQELGPKFYEISKKLKGRTAIMIKNRYFIIIAVLPFNFFDIS